MAAGVLAIGVSAFVLYEIFGDVTEERSRLNIVNAQSEDDVEEEWQLGQIMQIPGSPYVMIPLRSDRRNVQSDYSKSGLSVQNYLFINSETNESNWIFENNKHLILSAGFIPEEYYGSDQEDVQAVLYEVIKEDTNDDGSLSDEDLMTISLSRTSGDKYTEVVDDVEEFVGHAFFENDKLLIVYQKGGIGYSARIDLSGFVVSNETELSKVRLE